MSASMESIIAAALLAHVATWQSSGDFCEHAWLECECGETWDVENEPAAHLAHQARAVLAAISEAGAVEWGVRWAGDARHNGRRPTRCDSAQEAAELVSEQVIPHMWEVVSRIAGPWTAVD